VVFIAHPLHSRYNTLQKLPTWRTSQAKNYSAAWQHQLCKQSGCQGWHENSTRDHSRVDRI